MDHFMQVIRNEQPNIRCQMHQAMADKIAANREKLTSIIKTIVLCGCQNTVLRGHQDSATDLGDGHIKKSW